MGRKGEGLSASLSGAALGGERSGEAPLGRGEQLSDALDVAGSRNRSGEAGPDKWRMRWKPLPGRTWSEESGE